ncbi:hypothetical protein FRC08_004484, partial [Ceratobasidium sp. 394]
MNQRATRCLRRDFQALVETHERFLQSGDHAELNIWDRNRRHLVGYFDEFAEMLHRFLIYPELTPREKYELGLYEGSDGGEEYSAGVEEPLNEEEDHSSMEDSIGEDGEYMEEEAVLAAFAQASRQFFDLAVPYLWNNVDVIRLLDLLPETFPRGLGQIDTSEIPVPLSLSTGYFDRLSIYGAHVRTLSRIPTPNASESHLEHEHARLATTLATLTEGLLPNITTALTITTTTEGCPDQNLGVTLDWICALVFPARNLTRCSLNLNLYGIPDPPKKQLLRILGTILSNSRRIVYLELNTSYPWSPNERPWACFNSGTVPHYLTTFTVRPHILDSNCLAWMAQMSQLRNLRIRVPDMWQLGAQIPRFQGTVLPVGSFPSLKSLDISIRFGFEELFSQLWSTPIVTNLTELSIENYCSCTNPGIFPMIATGSPSLQQLQLAIVVGGFEICMLAPLRSLLLRASGKKQSHNFAGI